MGSVVLNKIIASHKICANCPNPVGDLYSDLQYCRACVNVMARITARFVCGKCNRRFTNDDCQICNVCISLKEANDLLRNSQKRK